jgi:serine/threonine protein kinase
LRADVSLLEKELQLLISLDHPNIIDFDELYMDDQNFAFVTQYCKGGDLFHQ